MDPMVVAGMAVLLLAIVAGVVFWRIQRSRKLRSTFGPEYDRAVKKTGGKTKAEADLLKREKRVSSFTVRPLVPSDRERFINDWRSVQAEFVDDPRNAIKHADAILTDVMAARGYPVTDFERQSEDLSVDHPGVVQNYRAGHHIAVRHERGEAGTEDLRQAMIHYRALFDELIEEQTDGKDERRGSHDQRR